MKIEEQTVNKSGNQHFLYLVVRHKSADPTYTNKWKNLTGYYLLESIVTEPAVLEACKQELAANRPVYIHRCGTEQTPPVIACSVQIDSIDQLTMTITFKNPKELILAPPRRINQGCLWYRDIAPVGS